MTDRTYPADPSVKPSASDGEQPEQLRQLLGVADADGVRHILSRLDDPNLRALDLSGVLPDAVMLSARSDDRLGNALEPSVQRAVHRAIHHDPDPFAQALYPAFAPAIRGAAPEALRKNLRELLRAISLSHYVELETFDDDVSVFDRARDDMKSCLVRKFRKQSARPSPMLWVFLVAVLALLGFLIVAQVREHRQWETYLGKLEAEPGIVVTAAGRRADPSPELLSIIGRVEEHLVRFPSLSDEPLPEDLAILEGLAHDLEKLAAAGRDDGWTVNITLVGHADSTGDETLNLELSLSRAEAVRTSLEERGIESGHLTAQGVGSSRPLDQTIDATPGRDRRVTAHVELVAQTRIGGE